MRCGKVRNKSKAGSLESIILDGAKRILGCSSKTCNEAVREDMGLDIFQSRRDRAMLKSWYKLATLPEDWYKLATLPEDSVP